MLRLLKSRESVLCVTFTPCVSSLFISSSCEPICSSLIMRRIMSVLSLLFPIAICCVNFYAQMCTNIQKIFIYKKCNTNLLDKFPVKNLPCDKNCIYLQSQAGSLAQLVQRICLTSRGSGVRIPQLPLRRKTIGFPIVFFCLSASAEKHFPATAAVLQQISDFSGIHFSDMCK